MCCDSATTRGALRGEPAQHQCGPGPDVVGDDGGAGEHRHAADHGVVAVGAQVGAEPGQLLGEHEPRLEDVLGDHRGAATRPRPAPSRTAAGRSGSPGRAASPRRRTSAAGGCARVKPVSVGSISAPAATSLSRTMSRWWATPPSMCRSPPAIAAAKTQVPATMRSVTVRCSTGCSRVDALDHQGRGGDARRCGRPSRPASGTGRRSPARGRRCRSRWCPRRAPRPSRRFSVAPTEGKSSHRLAPTQPVRHLRHDLPVLDADDGPELLQPADVHVEAARPDRVTAGQGDAGPAAPRDERAEHGDRGAQAAYEP